MKQAGFTLVEIVLALALVVVVLGLLGMAVDVHLRVADVGRKELEDTRLARMVLQRMGDDLRNAIPVTRSPSSIGCLRGNNRELQVETSRMPLLDAVQATGSSGEGSLRLAPPSDVRTVAYCVIKPGETGSLTAAGPRDRQCGLLRRECERAAFAWATQQGQDDELNRAVKVLAPEVEAIEFTYLDKSTTYREWDSAQQGKLPTAVKIAISIRPAERNARVASARATNGKSPSTVYESLVYLPNADAMLDRAIVETASQSAVSTSPEVKPTDSSSGGSGK
jgi:prepilin-type N-terminal cleavage/methylation domain-containing protein